MCSEKMSVEEEIELKDLIAQTLKSNGTLAKIKAQLRASIFLALDEDEKINKQKPLLNNKIKSFMSGDEGKAMFYIVHEFLEFFKLCFTLAVYEPESYIEYEYQQDEKERLLHQLGLGNTMNNNEPLLYQLLKIAQKSKRNLEVNINVNGNLQQENKSDSIIGESESVSVSENICSASNSDKNVEMGLENTSGIKEQNLNTTFDVHSPLYSKVTSNHNTNLLSLHNTEILKDLDNTQNKTHNDDTYEDTSSLPEDVESVNPGQISKVPEIKINGAEETETMKVNDKLKLSSPKSDKLKSKSNLSSLSDLPPLNKSRVSDILPSLYNKDFKDKSNLRELDKLFDMDAEYEEDFMYSGDDLSLRSDHSSVNLLEELQQSNKTNKEKIAALGKKDVKTKISSQIIADCKFKTSGTAHKNRTNNDSTENNLVSDNLESNSD